MKIKAIIFDFGRTLFDSDKKQIFFDAEDILSYCGQKGYRMAVVSLVSNHSNASLEERREQIETSVLRKYFEIIEVTDSDKDKSFDKVVEKFGFSRSEILIVDDRTIRGIRYGNEYGHPTVWFQNGKFANELPNSDTGVPTFIIKLLSELIDII